MTTARARRPSAWRSGRAATGPGRAGRVLPARVLVADDNADMREYLARLLRGAGYHVTWSPTGRPRSPPSAPACPTW